MQENLDTLTKIYVKFYIKQIQSSIPLLEYRDLDTELANLLDELEETPKNKDLSPNPANDSLGSPNKTNELTEEEKKLKKKIFVFNNKQFSRVEIMGIVVNLQDYSPGEGSARRVLYVDDSTGVIQCIIWKNKAEKYYNAVSDDFTVGSMVRILGQIDHFANQFEIVVERISKVNSFRAELLFHQTMQPNYEQIKKATVRQEISLQSVYEDSKTIQAKKNNPNLKDDVKGRQAIAIEQEFANRLYVYFLLFKTSFGTEDEEGYIKIPVQRLLEDRSISQMIMDFFGDNSKEAMEKYLKESFEKQLEPNMLGKIIYGEPKIFEEASLEIKSNLSKIKGTIREFIKQKSAEDPDKGANIQEIMQNVAANYGSFFTQDFIKYVVKTMTEDPIYGLLELGANNYTIMMEY